MFRKKVLGAALVVAIAISTGASQASAEAADAVSTSAVATFAQEGTAGEYAAAEYASIRTGDQATAVVDMGLDGYGAAPMTDGKRFSVFCISMVASLAVMLGVFGVTVWRKRNT